MNIHFMFVLLTKALMHAADFSFLLHFVKSLVDYHLWKGNYKTICFFEIWKFRYSLLNKIYLLIFLINPFVCVILGFIFLLLSWKSSLNVLITSPLSNIWFASISSYSVSRLFHLLKSVLGCTKDFNFVKSNWSIFLVLVLFRII